MWDNRTTANVRRKPNGSEAQLLDIQSETTEDPVPQAPTKLFLGAGQQEKRPNPPLELYSYYDVWDELTAQDGVLFN